MPSQSSSPSPYHHPKPGPTRRNFVSSLISAAVLVPWAFGQKETPTASDLAERFRRMSEDYEQKGLADPFRGITTNSGVVPGLFEIKPSGVSTEPVRNAAEKFIATLTSVQLARSMFPVDDIQWRKWMNQHFYARQGISLADMTDSQRDAAFGLMRASLSAKGFELTRNIMRLNETLAELSDDHDFLGNGSTTSPSWASRPPLNPGAGNSTAITRSSTTSCLAIRL